jgi:hypothetical protein
MKELFLISKLGLIGIAMLGSRAMASEGGGEGRKEVRYLMGSFSFFRLAAVCCVLFVRSASSRVVVLRPPPPLHPLCSMTPILACSSSLSVLFFFVKLSRTIFVVPFHFGFSNLIPPRTKFFNNPLCHLLACKNKTNLL